MRKPIVIVVGVLLLVAVAGAALWLWERRQHSAPAKDREVRLLIGFDPTSVSRVRIRAAGETLDRRRRHGGWAPMPGSPDSGAAVRLPLILRRLATLRVREAATKSTGRGKRSSRRSSGKVVAEIDVWRGRARPLRLRFFRKDRKVLLRSSDRPGIYEVPGTLLRLLQREMRRATQRAALSFTADKLASVALKRGARETNLVRRNQRWFVEDGGALAPADPVAVGRLLRGLQGLRVTHQLGSGPTARTKHGLDHPAMTIVIDDGKQHHVALGGACPKQPEAQLAQVGQSPGPVVCLTPLAKSVMAARYTSNRLFNVSADEVRALNVTRGRRTLALINRPGSGGWRMISPSDRAVDQAAAMGLVSSLVAMQGTPVPPKQPMPPPGARAVGHLKITPMTGAAERVDVWAKVRGGPGQWARMAGGGRWFTLSATSARLLGANPVLLRSPRVCLSEPSQIRVLARSGMAGRTEHLRPDGANWQLVLLAGHRSLAEATRIGGSLQEYQPKARSALGGAKERWTKPVLLVTEVDRPHRATLFHLISRIRARGFVAESATREHGFGRRPLRLTYRYNHSCVGAHAARKCKVGRCDVEFGGETPGGGCFARVVADGAVFTAPETLCRAVTQPLASRKVLRTALHRLSEIHLTTGGRTLKLTRRETGVWKKPDGSVVGSGDAGIALLYLAPLAAEKVVAYGARVTGKPVLRVRLEAPNQPTVTLRFYSRSSGDKQSKGYLVVRNGHPVRFAVRAAPVDRLRGLVPTKE